MPFVWPGAGRQRAAHPKRAFIQMGQKFGTDGAAESEIISHGHHNQDHADGDRHDGESPTEPRRDSARSERCMIGLCHSLAPFAKAKLASTGAIRIENIRAPSSANATVHAMGWNSLPSTRSSVKIGKYAVIMMAIA